MSDRNGIEIDYCPQCRGVWLDRGELDKIIERSGAQAAGQFGSASNHHANQPQHVQQQPQYERREYDDDNRYHHSEHNQHGSHNDHHKKHKKEGFLEDLFDF